VIIGEAQRRFRGSGLGLDLERPTPGETRLELVPVADVRLAELPTEVDLASLPEGGKVHEAGFQILEVAAAGADVLDQGLKLGDEGKVPRWNQRAAAKRDLLARGDLGAMSLELLMNLAKIAHSRAQKGEELVRFPHGEEALLHRLRV
jgi:hypothetical protein